MQESSAVTLISQEVQISSQFTGHWCQIPSTNTILAQEIRKLQREDAERQRLDAELAAREAASAAQLAQIELQRKQIEAQVCKTAF